MALEKYARKDNAEKRSKTIRARVPENLYKKWLEHVARLGLTSSEGIYLLIREEIEGKRRGGINVTTQGLQNDHDVITHKPQTEKRAITPRSRKRGGRFSYAPYVVDGYAPCPICESWVSRSNLSRHMGQHNISTEEAYTAHMAKVEAMVKEKRGG